MTENGGVNLPWHRVNGQGMRGAEMYRGWRDEPDIYPKKKSENCSARKVQVAFYFFDASLPGANRCNRRPISALAKLMNASRQDSQPPTTLCRDCIQTGAWTRNDSERDSRVGHGTFRQTPQGAVLARAKCTANRHDSPPKKNIVSRQISCGVTYCASGCCISPIKSRSSPSYCDNFATLFLR
jgi:hypothetical protein